MRGSLRVDESALHNDTSHKSPKQDDYPDWENNLKLETKNAKARTESWAKIADGVKCLYVINHAMRLHRSHLEALVRPVSFLWCWLPSSSSAFRYYSRIQLIPPTGCLLPTTSCLPKFSSPSSHRQMGRACHSRRLLPTILPSDPAILPCVLIPCG